MGNARRQLYNVTVTVWVNILTLQIVMEPAHILWKIGFAILYVSRVKNFATKHALKVNLKFNKVRLGKLSNIIQTIAKITLVKHPTLTAQEYWYLIPTLPSNQNRP